MKAHEITKSMKEERKALETAKKEIFDGWDKLLGAHVKKELDSIGEQADKAADHIYKKVGEQIDILINLTLGTMGIRTGKKMDVRPIMAERLKLLIEELVEELSANDDS